MCHKGGISLSVVGTVHKIVDVSIPCVLRINQATSSTDAGTILVWLHAVFGEVAQSLTELAEVLLHTNMPS